MTSLTPSHSYETLSGGSANCHIPNPDTKFRPTITNYLLLKKISLFTPTNYDLGHKLLSTWILKIDAGFYNDMYNLVALSPLMITIEIDKRRYHPHFMLGHMRDQIMSVDSDMYR
jgi:hypothetical protein